MLAGKVTVPEAWDGTYAIVDPDDGVKDPVTIDEAAVNERVFAFVVKTCDASMVIAVSVTDELKLKVVTPPLAVSWTDPKSEPVVSVRVCVPPAGLIKIIIPAAFVTAVPFTNILPFRVKLLEGIVQLVPQASVKLL